MTPSSEPRRRRDVKTQDREKSMSPLDKDQLKRRCLERVRTERSRIMARMRGRPGPEQGARNLYGESHAAAAAAASAASAETTADAISPLATTGFQRENSSPASLSLAREILHKGLSELSGGNSTTSKRQRQQQQQQHHHLNHKQARPPGTSGNHQTVESSPARLDNSGGSIAHHHPELSLSRSFLSAIEEENANYRNACSGGRGRGRGCSPPQQPQPRPPGGSGGDSCSSKDYVAYAAALVAPTCASRREEEGSRGGFEDGESDMADDSREADVLKTQLQPQQQHQQRQRQSEATVEGDELGWGCYCDEEYMLSPEEYEEMMQYIEEAWRDEDLRAEAEALEEYEVTKRLEEEEVEYAVSSALESLDGNGQVESVLCPVCKRDYLLQAGPPSAAIVCACGFRLDTGRDRLGLEHLKRQLAETYSQHSAACNAEPSFAVEGTPDSSVLWSSCDGCGFSRVVI